MASNDLELAATSCTALCPQMVQFATRCDKRAANGEEILRFWRLSSNLRTCSNGSHFLCLKKWIQKQKYHTLTATISTSWKNELNAADCRLRTLPSTIPITIERALLILRQSNAYHTLYHAVLCALTQRRLLRRTSSGQILKEAFVWRHCEQRCSQLELPFGWVITNSFERQSYRMEKASSNAREVCGMIESMLFRSLPLPCFFEE